MMTTIDKAGRIVVPKAIRDAMGLTAGGKVDIVFVDGKIEIEVPPAEVWLEIEDDGFPIIRSSRPLTAIDVRQGREEMLDERAAGRL